MKSHQRTYSKRSGFNLSKTTSHDEAYINDDSPDGGAKYSKSNSNRRFTLTLSSSRSSLYDISRPQLSSSKRIANEKKYLEALNNVVPIPIRETAIQGHSKILFHKIPKSNVRPRPLLKLGQETKFVLIHPSLLSRNVHYCVKIVSLSPSIYRNCSSGNQYELLLPTGTRSLGHTCQIIGTKKLQEQCPSCNSSRLSLFASEEQNHLLAYVFSCSSESERKKWLSVMSFALDCIKPSTTDKLSKQHSVTEENKSNFYNSRRSFSQGKICVPKSIYWSLKRERSLQKSKIHRNESENTTLTRVVRPNLQNERRQEISLNLWIQEAKNVPLKKRYFCEIYLDETLHAKTTTKTMTDLLFWGEEFNLCHLEQVSTLSILLWKASSDNRVKKKKSQQHLICQINIDTKDISNQNNVERWYPASYCYNSSGSEIFNSTMSQSIISSTDSNLTSTLQSMNSTNLSHSTASLSNNDHVPMIRIKARYQNIDVLPINQYSYLLEFLKQHSVQLLQEMDFYLKVKNKEDLVINLINILHKQGIAVEFLSDLLFQEIKKSDDENMILRGNSIASKAIEVYLKLIGEKYLNLILSDFVNRISQGEEDCEVDPQRSKCDVYSNSSLIEGQSTQNGDKSNNSHPLLLQRQESLMMNVDMIWAKILSSSIYFPRELRSVFVSLRSRLEQMDPSINQMNSSQSNLYERIVSSCIFLRFICPAILTPSLFGLLPEYPDNPKVLRAFTLVAKCIQSLANFSDLTGSKESYMLFMNAFIENKFETMQSFLNEISSPTDDENNRSKWNEPTSVDVPNESGLYWENLSSTLSLDSIDTSLCLAKLHRQFEEYLQMIPVQKYTRNIEKLVTIIVDINERMSVKSESNEQDDMKINQAYRELDKNIKEDVQKNCNDICGTLTRNQDTDQCHRNSKNKQPKKIKSANISLSTETSPTHTFIDRDSISGNYLMTQSMIQDHKDHPHNKYREQVDKEWKEMVCESTYYHNISNTNDKKKSKSEKFHVISSDSSGYETMNRSDSKIPNENEINLYEKLPLSSSVFKQSVKKCKQFRRKIEVPPISDSSDDHYLGGEQLTVSGRKFRSGSIDEIPKYTLYNNLLNRIDAIDSGSTETITSNSESRLNANKPSMNTCASLPSFKHKGLRRDSLHSLTDINLETFDGHIDNQIKMKVTPKDNARDVSNGPQTASNQTKEKQMKLSQNLTCNSNITLQQLLLADQKTVELELERVRLMRQICDTTAKPNVNLAAMSMDDQNQLIQQHNIKGFKEVRQLNNSNQLSVQRYLEIAENILINCRRNQIPKDYDFQEKENLIIQIFEINQSLQNTLIKNIQGFMFNSQSEKPDKFTSYESYPTVISNRLITARSSPSGNINQTSQPKPFSMNKGDSSSPSSSAIIEIIDAV